MASREEGILKGVFVIQFSAHTSPSEWLSLALLVEVPQQATFFHTPCEELSCDGDQDTVLARASQRSLPVLDVDGTATVGMEMKAGFPAGAGDEGVKWMMGQKVAGDKATSD